MRSTYKQFLKVFKTSFIAHKRLWTCIKIIAGIKESFKGRSVVRVS